MLIFAIETSCDDTAAAVVKNGNTLVSSVISSQIEIHKKFSGVVPELASRAHIDNINPVVGAALKKAGITFGEFPKKISAIAYTRGPGLAGSLLVGQVAAQTLSAVTGVPAVDIDHVEGHMYACLLEYHELRPPYLALTVSGGHTELTIVDDFGRYRYLGGTRDDAAGEAFDKVAKLLGLPYPGGPWIDKLARRGNSGKVRFTRPLMKGTWDFSFSGIKTAVVNEVRKNKSLLVRDVCASFQEAVVETIVIKTMDAAREFGLSKIVVGGGVAANSRLRRQLADTALRDKRKVYLPPEWLCTDNAAMIACVGYHKLKKLKKIIDPFCNIEPGLVLKNWGAR